MTEPMSDERLDQEIRGFLAWQAEELTGAPPAAHVATRISDRVAAPTAGLRVAPRLGWVLLAALLVIALLGMVVIGAVQRPPAPPFAVTTDVSPSAGPVSTPSQPPRPTPGATASPSLPLLHLPGAVEGSAGEYGWEGSPGNRRGMHNVSGAGERALTFAVGAGCLAAGEERKAVPVRVAGFDGVSVEPYQPVVTFGSMAPSAITRAYALNVGDRTLCVFITWDASTTNDELNALLKIPDTIRAEPVGEGRIRIVFTLDDGWDTG